MNQTHDLHNDSKETLVEVSGKLFKLVASEYHTLEVLKRKWPKEKQLPHVRHLNDIPIRERADQEVVNKMYEDVRRMTQVISSRNVKITSLQKAARHGADVPTEIQRLLQLKEQALKEKDEPTLRALRKQLRKLDYKRYLQRKE